MGAGLRNCRGAFLLEALIAVFILSFALVALIRGLLLSMNAAVEARHYSQAIITADNALIEVIRLNGKTVAGEIVLKNSDDAVAGNIAVLPSQNPAVSNDLKEARVRVVWEGKLKEKELTAVTLVFDTVDEAP